MIRNPRRSRPHRERSPLDILEETFHLLRAVHPRLYLVFYLGAAPFAGALLYFAADMSRSSEALAGAAFASLVMTGLYFWMRICQALFCKGLRDAIDPDGRAGGGSAPGALRRTAALCLLHAFQPPVLAVALVLAVPLGWAAAFFQNASVLAYTADPGRHPLRGLAGSSLRHAHADWAQNHGILIIFACVGLFFWINVMGTCILIPLFLDSFFGVQTIFTLNPAAALSNTTFLLGTLLLTHLGISPMIKAAYTLRCFYTDSRSSGADLLSRLAACRERRETARRRERGGLAAAVLAGAGALLLLSGGAPLLTAAEPEPAAAEFRERLQETMAQKKYQWRLPRRALETEEAGEAERSWLAQRLEEIAASVREGVNKVSNWVRKMARRLLRDPSPAKERPSRDGSGFWGDWGATLSLALLAGLLALLSWWGFALYRRHRRYRASTADGGSAADAPDLASESLVASQLPEEEWARLARECRARGETRLAVRALFLATLARLGEEGLLRIARSKSNRDYRSELSFRAHDRERLRAAFEENTGLFERVWYGTHSLSEEAFARFAGNHETIARESSAPRAAPSAAATGAP